MRARIENATTYTISPGQSNFRPLENPLPRFQRGFEIAVRFDESCWWSAEDWEGDQDRQDWNKLKGLAYYFGLNNHRSAMIAWRPSERENTFEVTAYTNNKRGGWKTTGNPVEVVAGEVFYASGNITGRLVEYSITSYGRTSLYTHPWDKVWLNVYREVGTSIGGANNSPGPYGGEATQDMKMEIDFCLT